MANRKGRRSFGNTRKLPSGRYQARYLGSDGFERLAPQTFATQREAEKWLTLTESDLLRGIWTAPEKAEIVLNEYAEKWIAERKLAPRTREIYESIYKLNIRPYLGELTLDAIQPSTIRSWRKKLLDDGRPEVQAVKGYRVLRAIFNTAIHEDEILAKNPCRIKGYGDQYTPERPVATLEQIIALAEAMPAMYHPLIMLAALSGLRWGELVALRRCDVDLEAGTVRIVRNLSQVKGKLIFGPPKSKAGIRTIGIPALALASLRVHLELNVPKHLEALLFTGERGALLRASNFRRAVCWDAAVKEAGLPGDFHFHDTRHLGNLLAAEAGASTKEMMHRLGQSTVRAAMIYQHATSKRDREITREIDKRVKRNLDIDDDDDEGTTGVPVRVG